MTRIRIEFPCTVTSPKGLVVHYTEDAFGAHRSAEGRGTETLDPDKARRCIDTCIAMGWTYSAG